MMGRDPLKEKLDREMDDYRTTSSSKSSKDDTTSAPAATE
jgi:hypothetical protein